MKPLAILVTAIWLFSGCGTSATGPAKSDGTLGHADRSRRHLFYLHPKIVEDQGLPAKSAEYGDFQYEAILEHFKKQGFVVHSELRPNGADVTVHANRTLTQIKELLAAGVRPESITVLGASKGAYIASLVSHLAKHNSINYVLLAGCSSDTVAYMRKNGIDLYGNILSIRDIADTRLAGSCASVFAHSPGINRSREIVLNVGTGHGIIFTPLQAWVRPAQEWAIAPHSH